MNFTKISSRIIILFICIVLIILTGLLFFIPSLAGIPALAEKYTGGSSAVLAVFLYIADIAAIWFMISLFRIMLSIASADGPFVAKNISALKQISAACAITFLNFLLMIILYNDYTCFGLMICTAILLFGTLCAFVLSRIFSEAVTYKSENDLTI